jgi:hypothetical protein
MAIRWPDRDAYIEATWPWSILATRFGITRRAWDRAVAIGAPSFIEMATLTPDSKAL